MPPSVMRLLVADPSRVTEQAVQRVYVAGMDIVPWVARSRLVDGELQIERSSSDSIKVHVPWQVGKHGEVLLATSTLMQRERPYHLTVELARGELCRLRNQIADWAAMSMVIAPGIEDRLREGLRKFAAAATAQGDPPRADALAQEAIEIAVETADALAGSYIEQALFVRHRQTPKLPTLMGVSLAGSVPEGEQAKALSSAINAAVVPFEWRTIEAVEGERVWDLPDRQLAWCRAQGLQVMAGPLLTLDERVLPDWLCLWEEDFDGLVAFVTDYLAALVERYRGQVSLWYCASRINVGTALRLREEQKLRLAIRAVEVVRRYDPQTPTILRFEQPWCEYLRRMEADRPPHHFVDDLLRAGLPLAGVGLEVNVGYYPEGTYCRSRLDYSRLIDLWSLLGLPLHLVLNVPSEIGPDAQAHNRSIPQPGAVPGGWTPEFQAAWARHYLPMLLSKPAVQAIVWNTLSDAEPHEYCHGGLFDADGAAKPIVASLAALRQKHLA